MSVSRVLPTLPVRLSVHVRRNTWFLCVCVCGQDLQATKRQEDLDSRLAQEIDRVQTQEEDRLSAMDVDVQADSRFAAQMLRDDEADEANRQAEVSERGCPGAVRPAHPRPHAPTHGRCRGLVRFPRAKHTRATRTLSHSHAHCASNAGGRMCVRLRLCVRASVGQRPTDVGCISV